MQIAAFLSGRFDMKKNLGNEKKFFPHNLYLLSPLTYIHSFSYFITLRYMKIHQYTLKQPLVELNSPVFQAVS